MNDPGSGTHQRSHLVRSLVRAAGKQIGECWYSDVLCLCCDSIGSLQAAVGFAQTRRKSFYKDPHGWSERGLRGLRSPGHLRHSVLGHIFQNRSASLQLSE